MRALVTGAAGFIGSTLVDRLLADGHQVIGIDTSRAGTDVNLHQAERYNHSGTRRFTLYDVDVQAPELTGIVAGTNPHVIFHLAAQVDHDASVSNPQYDARCNVLGTLNLCEASRFGGVRRIVYATCGVPRRGAGHRPADPPSPNAVGKLAGEMYLRAYAAMYGLAPISLALTNVYGPRQHPCGSANVIAALGSAMITGRPCAVDVDGSTAADYVYVDDVVDAFVRAAGAPIDTSGTYDIGSGRRTSVTQLHRMILATLDAASPRSLRTDSDDRFHGGELSVLGRANAKARNDFGWRAETDLAQGIARTTRWLRATLVPEPSVLASA